MPTFTARPSVSSFSRPSSSFSRPSYAVSKPSYTPKVTVKQNPTVVTKYVKAKSHDYDPVSPMVTGAVAGYVAGTVARDDDDYVAAPSGGSTGDVAGVVIGLLGLAAVIAVAFSVFRRI